ncbi:hypothetical protein BDV26DRAFT_269366 [Aspergillus bertholletiae]|uniref:Uncharacterized protein n=1 Tax=Aspergillus bertholletiae TaxID=1226010 RepID=A0A5N7AY21_9EURO|nr:hypothetical protein BDV26DRAFT_269366 [Aspergillus bertholletiae]
MTIPLSFTTSFLNCQRCIGRRFYGLLSPELSSPPFFFVEHASDSRVIKPISCNTYSLLSILYVKDFFTLTVKAYAS